MHTQGNIVRKLTLLYILVCVLIFVCCGLEFLGVEEWPNVVLQAFDTPAQGCLMSQHRPSVVEGHNLTVEVGHLEDHREMLKGGAFTNPFRLNPHRLARPRASCAREVQKNLHFVWYGKMRPHHVQSIVGFGQKNPAWTVMLWLDRPLDQESAASFAPLASREGGPVVVKSLQEEGHRFRTRDVIEAEPNLSGKSNYVRMEVVYLHGGIYMDTDAVAVRGLDEFPGLFRWPFMSHTTSGGYNNVCSCLFGFEKGSAFLSFALDAARENCIWWARCGTLAGAGSPFLTGALLRYNQPDILLIDQKYLVLKSPENIMYQTFEASWMNKL